MASLLPAFEYDIFISYRQKDNKGERWVSEFVDALKTELEATFKEEIIVYFDVNPQLTKSSGDREQLEKSIAVLPEAHFALGTYYYLGFPDYDKALDQVSIMEQKSKNNYECKNMKGNIYRRSGNWT